MLDSVNDFKGCKVGNRDEELGRCKDLWLDVQLWIVPYLVIEMKNLLGRRQVAVPFVFSGRPEPETRRIPVRLDRAKIEEAPFFDLEKGVIEEDEIALLKYYGLDPYWTETEQGPELKKIPLISPLFPGGEVIGFSVQGLDREIGRVADFLMERGTGRIRYVIVDAGNWFRGRQVCLAMNDCLRGIDTEAKRLTLDISSQHIEKAPEYNPVARISREYQLVLHDYYGWPKYWEEDGLKSTFTRQESPLNAES